MLILSTIWLNMKKSLRKSLSLTARIVLSLMIFYGFIYILYVPFFMYAEDSFHFKFLVLFSILYFVILPFSVYLGAVLTGWIYQPENGPTFRTPGVRTPGVRDRGKETGWIRLIEEFFKVPTVYLFERIGSGMGIRRC